MTLYLNCVNAINFKRMNEKCHLMPLMSLILCFLGHEFLLVLSSLLAIQVCSCNWEVILVWDENIII